MQKTKIALAATLIGLAGYSSQGATIFDVSIADAPPLKWYWILAGSTAARGATSGNFLWATDDAVLTRDETGGVFWDKLIAGEPVRFVTGTSDNPEVETYTFPAITETEGVNYLWITFTPTSVTLRGLDELGDLQDVGPWAVPDGGATAGLLGLSLATLGFAHRRRQ